MAKTFNSKRIRSYRRVNLLGRNRDAFSQIRRLLKSNIIRKDIVFTDLDFYKSCYYSGINF